MKTIPTLLTPLLAAGFCITGPAFADDHGDHGDEMHAEKQTKMEMSDDASGLASVEELVAIIQPASGSDVRGSVLFEKTAEGVKVTARVGGFEPDTKHGIHIHQFGDISAEDGTSAGGHYNPGGHDHALPESGMRHAGDLGNLTADADGNATLTMTVDNVTLAGKMNPIIGRTVVIHAKEDDGGQPTGNAGARIGVGVIGIGQGESDQAEASNR